MPPTAAAAVKRRWIGFLLWQTLSSLTLLLLLLPLSSLLPSLLSLLLFSLSLLLLVSPHPSPPASPLALLASLVRYDPAFRRRAGRTLGFAGFLVLVGISGGLGVAAVCVGVGGWEWGRVRGFGVRGVVVGVVYGVWFLCWKRWVLRFPIVQRPLVFSFKIGILSSLRLALKLSISSFLCSTLLMMFMPKHMKNNSTLKHSIIDQITFFVGTVIVIFSWELSHNLLQAVHTRRCIFSPSQGSAAAEANPSEALLESLEQSSSRSLLHYLAYMDLCVIASSNVEPWRRAAFFEETGETYRRVISSCLRPLEQLTSSLGEVFEGFYEDKSGLLSLQLSPPTDAHSDMRIKEAFDDFQICSWSASAVAALTAHSIVEDRFGVAQLTGCNAASLSALLSCLLAVEACLGKKTSPQPAHLLGPGSIRWAALDAGRRGPVAATSTKKRNSALHGMAYAMADVLKNSIYEIVCAFENDMIANSKASALEKNWITEGKPMYGTREILVQKLRHFLEFRA